MRDLISAYDMAIALGVVCIIAGVALLSVPAALIVGGCLLIGVTAGAYRLRRRNHGAVDRVA